MEVKVLKDFKNKYSKTIHRKDEVIEVSKKRFEEINSTEYGKLVDKIGD